MSQSEEEPLLDIAHGDEVRSRHLRDSLKVLRDRVPDENFQRLVDDALAGKSSIRDLATSEVFGQAVAPLAQQAVDQMNEMTEEEKRDLAEKGQQDFDDLNRGLISQGGARTGSVPSQESDDDDDDFSDGSFLESIR